jgi:hypothetical protein
MESTHGIVKNSNPLFGPGHHKILMPEIRSIQMISHIAISAMITRQTMFRFGILSLSAMPEHNSNTV